MTGCVEEYEADLPNKETHLLVVNGTICSNQLNEFHLTWSSPIKKNGRGYLGFITYSNEAPQPVFGAKITICGTDGMEYRCTEQYGSDAGKYTCDLPKLNPDVAYYVTIECAGDVYKSNPESPIRTPDIDSFECFQKDSLSDIEVLLTTAASDNPDKTTYFTWDYSETWELRPARTTRVYYDMNFRQISTSYFKPIYPKYGWKTEDSDSIFIESTAHYTGGKLSKYQIVKISRNDERISWNYCNDLRLRAISKAEYEYELACRQAECEMGGLFTPQPPALPTNIRCLTSSKRVIGYVGCSQNVATKRMYIDGTKISRVLPEGRPITILKDCNEYDDCYQMIEDERLLYQYIDNRRSGGTLETWWVYPMDLDVRFLGAEPIKPEYMPPFGEKYNFYEEDHFDYRPFEKDPDEQYYDPDEQYYDPDEQYYDPDEQYYDPDEQYYDPDELYE